MNETNGRSAPAITLNDISKIKDLLDGLEASRVSFADDLRTWMTKQGFPPEKGCYLILPASRRDELPLTIWPAFVRFCQFIDSPILMRDPFGTL